MLPSTNAAGGWHVVAIAAAEIVEDGDAMAARDERIGDVRADEAGAAGDENAQPRICVSAQEA